jgi:hypothetical protein
MGELTLQPGEKFVAAAQAQLAEGFSLLLSPIRKEINYAL